MLTLFPRLQERHELTEPNEEPWNLLQVMTSLYTYSTHIHRHLITLLMSKRRLNPLLLMLMFLLPLLRELTAETVLEDFTDRLKRHALDVWVEEDDKQPADEADSAVEAEGSGGGDAFHHA